MKTINSTKILEKKQRVRSQAETIYLLKSANNKKKLLEAVDEIEKIIKQDASNTIIK